MDKKIIVYGTRWCGDTIRALKVLDDRNIPYQWIDINVNNQGAKFVRKINHGCESVPTIVFPDQSILVEPSNYQLLQKLTALNL